MTIVEQPSRTSFELVTVDLYRDVHKGIRAELFALVSEAGRLDPSIRCSRVELADHIGTTVDLLVAHAEHEDTHVQPAIEIHLPVLAEQIATDHVVIEARMDRLVGMASRAVDASAADQVEQAHRLYLELASFTGAYLEHQDVEERVVMPALEAAIGVESTIVIHQAIVGSIPPDQMAHSLGIMLPAMNIDERAALLGGIQAGAPAPVFEGVFGLAGSVLTPSDHAALAVRLGVA
jgi:hypothetical protein